jgi:hypothetical protein
VYTQGTSTWSVSVEAPNSGETGWSFGASMESAYKSALQALCERLEGYGDPEDRKIAESAAKECLGGTTLDS